MEIILANHPKYPMGILVEFWDTLRDYKQEDIKIRLLSVEKISQVSAEQYSGVCATIKYKDCMYELCATKSGKWECYPLSERHPQSEFNKQLNSTSIFDALKEAVQNIILLKAEEKRKIA